MLERACSYIAPYLGVRSVELQDFHLRAIIQGDWEEVLHQRTFYATDKRSCKYKKVKFIMSGVVSKTRVVFMTSVMSLVNFTLCSVRPVIVSDAV